jgi:putative hemolysin
VVIGACFFATIILLLDLTAFAQAGASSTQNEQASHIFRNLGIVFLLIFMNAGFAMAEAALLSVRRSRIEQLVEEGNRSAQLVSRLLADPTRMLSTIQVGVTLVGLFSAAAAAESTVGPFTHFLQNRFPNTLIASLAHGIAFVIIVLGVSLLTLVIGEITPKSIAIVHAERISLLCAWPIHALQTLFKPVVWLVTSLSSVLVRPFGGTAGFHTSVMSEDELRLLVEQSEEHGVIETEEKEMIHKVFEFGDIVVRKVMTPRLDITAIEADADVEELIRVVSKSGHSRIPVYDDNLDNIIGLVHVKDVLKAIGEGRQVSIREIMRPAFFIPDNKRVDDLLTELRRNRIQFAIVRDEYGTVTGVVTIEDLLEEIVGEIQDEYDVEEPMVTQIDSTTCIVDGRMPIEDYNERFGAELPVEEADTLGGFVFGLMGHQPVQGETAIWNGHEFRVEATDGRRIQKVRITRHPVSEPDNNGAEPELADERGTNPSNSPDLSQR